MYDTFLSRQWVYDRCLEGSTLFPWLVGLCVVIISILLYKSTISGKKEKLPGISLTVLGTLGAIPLMYALAIFFGYFILNCSDARGFWPSITPANLLHDRIKIHRRLVGVYPKNDAELRALEPTLYAKVAKNSKLIYVYDAQRDTYTWLVRPSRYIVVVFDQSRDFRLYTIPNWIRPTHWDSPDELQDSVKTYPPDYEGPWQQLPE